MTESTEICRDIIVVGGGASGLLSALLIDDFGGQVLVLERNDRIGKKLLATGNGRCNFSNRNIHLLNYHGEDPSFAEFALKQFDSDATVAYFESLGLSCASENAYKLFPRSFQASSFLDIFLMELSERKIPVETNCMVSDITVQGDGFLLRTPSKRRFRCRKLILATGGAAMPASGSDGNGYALAKKMGHRVTETFPALVQLDSDFPFLSALDGVKITTEVSLLIKDQEVQREFGDVLWTKYGLSGPPILQLSRRALASVRQGDPVSVAVALVSSTKEELISYLLQRFEILQKRSVFEALIGFMNKRLIGPLLKCLNIDRTLPAAHLSQKQIIELAELMLSWHFKITGSRPFSFAQVTAGGVDTSEVNPTSMQSRLLPNLFFSGELLDVDGDCGGFNLQWAWSSAYVAATNIIE